MPSFQLKSEPIELHHQALITDALHPLQAALSEFCFANLFLFRHIHKHRLVTIDSSLLCLQGKTRDQFDYLMPLFRPKTLSPEQLVELLKETNSSCYFPIPEGWLGDFPESLFISAFLENDSDYLYHAAKLKTLSGRNLAKKRNLISQFERTYSVSSASITKANVDHAMAVLQQWNAQQEGETDFKECQEALELLSPLNLHGQIYYAQDAGNVSAPAGFLIGEKLTHEVYAFHFAKGVISYKGIYPLNVSRIRQKIARRDAPYQSRARFGQSLFTPVEKILHARPDLAKIPPIY